MVERASILVDSWQPPTEIICILPLCLNVLAPAIGSSGNDFSSAERWYTLLMQIKSISWMTFSHLCFGYQNITNDECLMQRFVKIWMMCVRFVWMHFFFFFLERGSVESIRFSKEVMETQSTLRTTALRVHRSFPCHSITLSHRCLKSLVISSPLTSLVRGG